MFYRFENRRCHRPTRPFRRDDDEGHKHTPTISRLTAEDMVNGGDLLQRAQQDRADQWPNPGGGAADHRIAIEFTAYSSAKAEVGCR